MSLDITHFEKPVAIGMGRIEATIYHRNASHPHSPIMRLAGWYYFLSVTLVTGEKLSGQVTGPFNSANEAHAAALEHQA